MRADKGKKTYTVTGVIALALVLTATGCTTSESKAGATTPSSSASNTLTSAAPTATPSPVPTTTEAPETEAPPTSTPAPAPEVPAPAPVTPPKQVLSPQPLGPQASPEDLAKAREALLDYGYSPEEAAGWPTLAVVVPEEAINVIAALWGRGSNLTYEATLDPDRLVYVVTVIVRSPYDDDEPPVTAVWEVRSDGNYSWIS